MATTPDGLAVFSDIAQIRREHTASGGHFFDRDTMRFFRSTILPTLYGQRHNVFVTREVFEDGGDETVLYSVRRAEWEDRGADRFLTIDTVSGGFDADGNPVHPDRGSAVRAARAEA